MVNALELLGRKSPAVHSIEPDAPVLMAIERMAERGIGALLVMSDGELLGIVSERDYARKVILCGRSSSLTPVEQIMSAPVLTIGPDCSLRECMQLVTRYRVRHLPVVDADGQVLGVVSIGDLLCAVLEEQREASVELERSTHGQ